MGATSGADYLVLLIFRGVSVSRSSVSCAIFCRLLFVLLYYFQWPLDCLSFFDLRILITTLVPSISFFMYRPFILLLSMWKVGIY
jgi:hypothetical protein